MRKGSNLKAISILLKEKISFSLYRIIEKSLLIEKKKYNHASV